MVKPTMHYGKPLCLDQHARQEVAAVTRGSASSAGHMENM